VLRAKGDGAGLRAFWQKQADGEESAPVRVALLYRIGEHAESAGDQETAREAMEAVLALDAGFLLAIEALQRIYTRQEAWSELASVHDRRASLTTDREERATFLHRSGAVYEHRLPA
jgi:hypothetical protein